MKQETVQILFKLLHKSVDESFCGNINHDLISEEEIAELFSVSKSHDIAHLVAMGLEREGLLPKDSVWFERFKKEIMLALYRYELLKCDFEMVCTSFEMEQITFLPLKGAVIREFYPEAWMRTSCDIDVLVKNEDYQRAIDYLIGEHKCTIIDKSSHDISLSTPNGNTIELHHKLIENKYLSPEACGVLKSVWDSSNVKNGLSYWYKMSDELFYFYHIAHTAKHFYQGGCGIKPIIDLWILKRTKDASPERMRLLERGGLLKFASSAESLCSLWFENGDSNEVLLRMQNFVVSGGLFGSGENSDAVKLQKKGGRFLYGISHIFMPYKLLKKKYPILNNHKWLTPVFVVYRVIELLFTGKAKRVMERLREIESRSGDDGDNIGDFLNNIGL